MALLAALGRLLFLPGRLLIRHLDRERARHGLTALGPFLRGCTHGFVGLLALMAFSMATAPTPAPAAAPVVRTAPRYVPPPAPTGVLEPMPTTAATKTTPTDEVDDAIYVPLPDDDDDWDKPRICHRKWWC